MRLSISASAACNSFDRGQARHRRSQPVEFRLEFSVSLAELLDFAEEIIAIGEEVLPQTGLLAGQPELLIAPGKFLEMILFEFIEGPARFLEFRSQSIPIDPEAIRLVTQALALIPSRLLALGEDGTKSLHLVQGLSTIDIQAIVIGPGRFQIRRGPIDRPCEPVGFGTSGVQFLVTLSVALIGHAIPVRSFVVQGLDLVPEPIDLGDQRGPFLEQRTDRSGRDLSQMGTDRSELGRCLCEFFADLARLLLLPIQLALERRAFPVFTIAVAQALSGECNRRRCVRGQECLLALLATDLSTEIHATDTQGGLTARARHDDALRLGRGGRKRTRGIHSA